MPAGVTRLKVIIICFYSILAVAMQNQSFLAGDCARLIAPNTSISLALIEQANVQHVSVNILFHLYRFDLSLVSKNQFMIESTVAIIHNRVLYAFISSR